MQDKKQVRWTPVQCAQVFAAQLEAVLQNNVGSVPVHSRDGEKLSYIADTALAFHVLVLLDKDSDGIYYTGYKIGRLYD